MAASPFDRNNEDIFGRRNHAFLDSKMAGWNTGHVVHSVYRVHGKTVE